MLISITKEQCDFIKRILMDQLKREDSNELPYSDEDKGRIDTFINSLNKAY